MNPESWIYMTPEYKRKYLNGFSLVKENESALMTYIKRKYRFLNIKMAQNPAPEAPIRSKLHMQSLINPKSLIFEQNSNIFASL